MKGILMRPEVWKAKQPVLDQYGEAQSRRVIKPQPEIVSDGVITCLHWKGRNCGSIRGNGQDWLITQARYQVGETVYIKEKALYWVSPIIEGVEYDKPSYRWTDCVYQDDPDIPALLADNGRLAMERSINQIVEGSPIIGKWEWKSAMFMPEHYARHFLTITGVRAERVQEITEDDALAEGITIMRGTWQSTKWNHNTQKLEATGGQHPYTACYHFEAIWNSINKDYPFESNPFVFVYTFRQEIPR